MTKITDVDQNSQPTASASGAPDRFATKGSSGEPGSGEDIRWDYEVEVVVAGAGNGGVSAALAAATGGAKTLLIEIGTQIGGNSLISGGVMHTSGQRTWEEYNRYTQGLHDQVLAKVFVETFWNEYIPWLVSHNAYMSRPTPDIPGPWGDWMFGKGEPGQLRHKLYFDSLMRAYHGAGGATLMQTRVVKLYADDEGRVIGLRAKCWQGSPREENQRFINIRARKTIMAVGGWIMNGALKNTHIGQDGHFSGHYCGPFSSGEGMAICQKVGAALSNGGWSTFSGSPECVTATPLLVADMEGMLKMFQENRPEDWTAMISRGRLVVPMAWVGGFAQFGGTSRGILVNNYGERFIDESSPVAAAYPRTTQAIARQFRGFVWVVVDQKIFDAPVPPIPYLPASWAAFAPNSRQLLDAIIAEGGVMGTHGNVIIAQSLNELADALSQTGMPKGAFLRTIEEYNTAVDKEAQETMEIPHFAGNGSGGWAIRTPPFYAVPMRANPYLMFGGLRIDRDARVLDHQGVPVTNLYAPPPLGGGIQNEVYTGSIASAGTFGYRAAKHALAALRQRREVA